MGLRWCFRWKGVVSVVVVVVVVFGVLVTVDRFLFSLFLFSSYVYG